MKRQTGTGINEQLEVTGSGSGGGDASAANQLIQIAQLAAIEAETAHLDVNLSTRASEATLALVSTEATLALIKAKTDNLDVALSTRTKPADQQHTIVDSITAGSSIIGKVGIDQTTPGTTNGVQVNAALPAGTNSIGDVKTNGYKNATWSTSHLPAANTVATITQASAGGSNKNVCTGFTVTLCGQATAPAAVQLSVALIDGAAGGTTYLWRTVISLPAVAGAITAFVKNGTWFVGAAATAMTLEFSAAGGANTIESVTMDGTTTT